jgi:formamidase
MARVVALPPNAQSVHVGSGGADIKEKVGKEGARTIPGRPEHGGNCDIKNLSRGSKVFLPVHVKGAKFSVGDLHFSRTFNICLLTSYIAKLTALNRGRWRDLLLWRH